MKGIGNIENSFLDDIDVVMPVRLDRIELMKMTEDTITSLKQSEKDYHFNLKVIVDDGTREFNYNRFLCEGIVEGKNEWVVLTNNDLVFHPHWFSEILKVYNSDPTIQSFGAWEPRHSPKFFKNEQPYYLGYRIAIELTGWLIVVRREVLEKIDFCNPINQRVNFWSSDRIYADLLKRHKIKHALVREAKVTHLFSKTLNRQTPERKKELTYTQRKIYDAGTV